jgi:hypothetical protein
MKHKKLQTIIKNFFGKEKNTEWKPMVSIGQKLVG